MNAIEIRATWTLASLFALRMLGFFMILPVFAVYGQALQGATPALIGLAIGAYGLTQALFQIPFGYLSDRFGRIPIIVTGLLIFALGSLVAAWSDTIYGVILGRALQGAGAIAAAVMALLSDVTQEEQRTKVMAMVGASIGLSFSLALILGPWIVGLLGLKGVFLLTAVMTGVGILITLFLVPRPQATPVVVTPLTANMAKVLRDTHLLRLDLGVFLLHMTMTALFVVVPDWLWSASSWPVNKHWQFYLPILLLSFLAMVPLMVIAERKGKSKQVFLLAISLLCVAMLVLGHWHAHLPALVCGLFVYFFGFNLLEAMLPSLVSKQADPSLRGASMGVYSTCQFLGAFVGGAGGGWLLGRFGGAAVCWIAACGLLAWWLLALGMRQTASGKQTEPSLAMQYPEG